MYVCVCLHISDTIIFPIKSFQKLMPPVCTWPYLNSRTIHWSLLLLWQYRIPVSLSSTEAALLPGLIALQVTGPCVTSLGSRWGGCTAYSWVCYPSDRQEHAHHFPWSKWDLFDFFFTFECHTIWDIGWWSHYTIPVNPCSFPDPS